MPTHAQQKPVSANGPGTESTVPAPKTKNADTDTGDNVLRGAEEQMSQDLTKLQTE